MCVYGELVEATGAPREQPAPARMAAVETPDCSRAAEPGPAPWVRSPEPAPARAVTDFGYRFIPTTTATTVPDWPVSWRQPHPARRPPPGPHRHHHLLPARPPNGAPRCVDCPDCRALSGGREIPPQPPHPSETWPSAAAVDNNNNSEGYGSATPGSGRCRRRSRSSSSSGGDDNACLWHRHYAQHGARLGIGALFRLAEDYHVGGGGGGGGGGEEAHEQGQQGYGRAVARVRELAAVIATRRGDGYYGLLASSARDCCGGGGLRYDDDEEEEGRDGREPARPDSLDGQPQPQPRMDHTNGHRRRGDRGGHGDSFSSSSSSWATIDGMEPALTLEERGEVVEMPGPLASRASVFGAIGDSRPSATAAAAEQPRYTWLQKGKWREKGDWKEAEDSSSLVKMPTRTQAILAWMMDADFTQVEHPLI
ncbi:hypothetical protein GGTG_01877 [Gaeumannomyces tritici R3-111a-1]|uniref:Uncharacterized protein n=1 Tax=Gaeumannomyces tritici (strain R3-111a-1) TaxID=644352 RepID=J3NKT6_GAET3|nr:hypothetical protein GGTG_01877 [Gaeumannomyces tritici R3-111a-1]EJT81903.1 hypothetical protein GGTG_01877 [Gaeumannomyces tritici R3-111a-1]